MFKGLIPALALLRLAAEQYHAYFFACRGECVNDIGIELLAAPIQYKLANPLKWPS
jgi:hypothetical protein